jgi:dTDP-glucose 4,6-dehydratase
VAVAARHAARHRTTLILVTGGAGFIGSNFVLSWLAAEDAPVLNLDKLTYAGNLENLAGIRHEPRHRFVHGDIRDRALVSALLNEHRPSAIVHFAAETHVDRSIHAPADFIDTNVAGTFALLEEARAYWSSLAGAQKEAFRFLHVSTDEVYGSLDAADAPATETSRYAPNSPYAASKAAADHLVRAWHRTYGLPAITTHCSNNYGAFQFPEKLIPLMVLNASRGKPLPVYGDGGNVRDWLYVEDHCDALRVVLARGRPGHTYNIAGETELTNIDVVRTVCALLDELSPQGAPHARWITFVADRPGHDRRYALSARKVNEELGWQPRHTFQDGLRRTVQWYLSHQEWVDHVTSGSYRQWLETNYGARGAA